MLFPKRSRTAWLGVTVGLLAMLTVILLLGSQETAAAPAALLIPQTQANTAQTLPLMTTTLLVGTSADYWPMEYISGTQIIGHDIDLMNALAAELSATLVYTIVPWGGIFAGLKAYVRPTFIASPEHTIFCSDFSSIEARRMMWYANDPQGMAAVKAGRCLYKTFAAEIYQKSYDDITSQERTVGKVAQLGCQYRMGVNAFIQFCEGYRIPMSEERAKYIIYQVFRKC